MSGRFVYRPPIVTPRYPGEEPEHYGSRTFHSNRPFIPDLPLFTHTPYTHSDPRRHRGIPLPDLATPDRAHGFPSLEGYNMADDYESGPERRPSHRYERERQWLQDPPNHRRRRHSFGSARRPAQHPQFGAFDGGSTNRPAQYPHFDDFDGGARIPPEEISEPVYINPWINAHAPLPSFFLDLLDLSPTHHDFRISGRFSRLTDEFLDQPATYPPKTRMRIIIKEIPQWPCDLRPHAGQIPPRGLPPILLRDVLMVLFKHLQKRVEHADWHGLSDRRKRAVAWAFQRRCMKYGEERFREERDKGVKRVDFLMGKTRMVGLLWDGRIDGWDIMKLVVDHA